MASEAVLYPDEQLGGVSEQVLELEAGIVNHEIHLYLPKRIFGECAADHMGRGAPNWSDPAEEAPPGEEGGTAWTPDNAWLREEE